MSNKKEKGPDEIYCRSCGEIIKKEAEICPHCGVPQEGVSSSTSQATTSKSYSPSHDPSQYETSVTNTWWYGLAGGVLIWIIGFILMATVSGDAISSPLAVPFLVLLIVAWIMIPISAYFDIQYIRANSKWNPHTVFWVILLLPPMVNTIFSAVYLYRRYEVFGAS